MPILFLAEYTAIIFVLVLISLFLKNRRLFFISVLSLSSTWFLTRILEVLNFKFLHLLPKTFPSDHAALGFSLSVIVFSRYRIWGVVLLALAMLMSWARVIAGFHYYIDITGGIALGVIVSLLILAWLKDRTAPS